MTSANKAVFLDRDGTLIKHVPYLHDPQLVELSPGAPKALSELKAMGFLLIVVTNQSGVARGYYVEEDIRRVNRRVNEVLEESGGPAIDAFYYCPHFPEGVIPEYSVCCNCRKPSPGMALRAALEHDIDLKRSYIIGDTYSKEIVMGLALGMVTVLYSSASMERPPGVLAVIHGFSDLPRIIETHTHGVDLEHQIG